MVVGLARRVANERRPLDDNANHMKKTGDSPHGRSAKQELAAHRTTRHEQARGGTEPDPLRHTDTPGSTKKRKVVKGTDKAPESTSLIQDAGAKEVGAAGTAAARGPPAGEPQLPKQHASQKHDGDVGGTAGKHGTATDDGRAGATVAPAPTLPVKKTGPATKRQTKKQVSTLTADESVSLALDSGHAAAAAAAAAAAGDADLAPPAKKIRAAKKDDQPAGPLYTTAMRPPPPAGPAFKILSWNLAGLRAVLKKDADVLRRLVEAEGADLLCLQETKLQEKDVAAVTALLPPPLSSWHASWSSSVDKLGASGVATLCRAPPLSTHVGFPAAPHLDGEGRVITTELADCYVVNVYSPNSGQDLGRLDFRTSQWDVALSRHVNDLQAGAGGTRPAKPVVLVGDLNCAHEPIDLARPKTNLKTAGFTPEERASFEQNFLEHGLIDTFRHQHPDAVGYTYYSHRFNCRAKNLGWRLDYFLVSQGLLPRVHDSFILRDYDGSDHVPLGLTLCDATSAA